MGKKKERVRKLEQTVALLKQYTEHREWCESRKSQPLISVPCNCSLAEALAGTSPYWSFFFTSPPLAQWVTYEGLADYSRRRGMNIVIPGPRKE